MGIERKRWIFFWVFKGQLKNLRPVINVMILVLIYKFW